MRSTYMSPTSARRSEQRWVTLPLVRTHRQELNLAFGATWLESAASMEVRLDGASGEAKGSTTQPFSDRRHTRSGTDGANDDKDAHDRDKPHSLYPEYPCRDHDGQDYGANNEPVEVHPPGEQATQHCGSVWHTAHLSDRPKMPGRPSGTPLHPGLARKCCWGSLANRRQDYFQAFSRGPTDSAHMRPAGSALTMLF